MANTTKLRVVVLAATKMVGAICIAGVDSQNRWIRPVPPGGHNFPPAALAQAGKVVVEPYNEVDFVSRGARGVPPQTEDVEIDVRRDPQLVRTLGNQEVAQLLRRIDESGLVSKSGSEAQLIAHLVSRSRSLLVAKVDEIVRAYRKVYQAKSQRRIMFRVGHTTLDLSCTDLRWRAMTRGNQDESAVSQVKSADEIYFALGLTRPFDHDYYCMVIGVHPVPLLTAEVDYGHL